MFLMVGGRSFAGQWQFDARASPKRGDLLYGSLRDACEQEPALGYALMRATAGVLPGASQSTRVRVAPLRAESRSKKILSVNSVGQITLTGCLIAAGRGAPYFDPVVTNLLTAGW
jgi:hypothetical protein